MNVAELYAPPSTAHASEPPAPLLAPTPFTIRSLVDEAWASYKAQWLPLSGVTLVFGILFLGFDAFCTWEAERVGTWWAPAAARLVSILFSAFLTPGLIRIWLHAARRQSFSLATLFSGVDVYFTSLFGAIVSAVLILAGTICLVVPGVVVAVALQLVPWLVAERRANAWDSIHLSFRLTRGHRGQLAALLVVVWLVTTGGVFACGVGLLAAYPLGQLMLAHAYRHLAGDARSERASPLTLG